MVICKCGCGENILEKTYHKYVVPLYKVGHHNKGKHLSDTHRNRIGNANKGKKGKRHSEETKQKTRKIHKNKIFSDITKLRISKAKIGTTQSINTRQKISLTLSKKEKFEGFITPLNKAIRTCEKYAVWRAKIFEKDLYTCQNCRNCGVYLEVHHKKMFSKILKENDIKTIDDALICDELWNINNGVTYCRRCHMILDKERRKFGGE